MPTPPEAISVERELAGHLGRVRARVAARQGLRVAAIGIVAFGAILAATQAAQLAMAVRATGAGALSVCGMAAIWIATSRSRTLVEATRLIERRHRSLRNLAVTAEELMRRPDRAQPYVRERVIGSASSALRDVDAAQVVPLKPEAAWLAVSALVVAVALPVARPGTTRQTSGGQREGKNAASSGVLEIDVAPPAYTGFPVRHVRDPNTMEALAGSVASVRVTGHSQIAVRVNGTMLAGQGAEVRVTLAASGSVAIDAGDFHRLLPLIVTPDAAPAVRVTAPARDLRLTDRRATIAIQASAADDIALRSLQLRYTVVSGTGEQFTFKEGTLPAALAKASDRTWTADATLSLGALKLEPGDALVYRAVAADARPGTAGEASSDTYFVEIAGPGDVALEGVDMPPDKERYALSQAMIVVKIQRLIAREASLGRAELEEAAASIAAEQRAVRANFIFLLGGEVEDEVVEAETSHEIQEGRLANQARKEIVAATVLMARVEQALAAMSTRAALPIAQEAVRTLQRAFGHSRYLLRALPARARLDPSRRLSGDLTSVGDWRRDLVPPAPDPVTDAARTALADVIAAAGDPESATVKRLSRLAEEVIAVEPGAVDLQGSSRLLLEAGDAFAAGQREQGRAKLASAAAALLQRAQRGRVAAAAPTADVTRLAGAAALAGGGR